MKTKKEQKQAYKQMKFQMGVFILKNTVNNKVFIDNSLDIPSKLNRHKIELKFGNHRNKSLQNEWDTYGPDNFTFKVIHTLKEKEDENINYVKELSALQALAEEELNHKNTLFY